MPRLARRGPLHDNAVFPKPASAAGSPMNPFKLASESEMLRRRVAEFVRVLAVQRAAMARRIFGKRLQRD
jgi:hypothetical protein